MKKRSGEHPRSQLLQALIGSDQHGCFAAGQGQIQTVVDGVIQMAGQRQRLCLQVTVRLNHINQLHSPAQAPLQPIHLKLTRALKAPLAQPPQ